MPFPTDAGERTKRLVVCALFAAAALLTGVVESLFPLPFPGMRLGLANIFPLLALVLFGGSEACFVALLRLSAAFFITGNAFALACSAAGLICSLPLSIWLYAAFREHLSIRAISVASAAAFNVGQITAVVLMMGEPAIFLYLPVLTLVGIFTGYAVGVLSERLTGRLQTILRE